MSEQKLNLGTAKECGANMTETWGLLGQNIAGERSWIQVVVFTPDQLDAYTAKVDEKHLSEIKLIDKIWRERLENELAERDAKIAALQVERDTYMILSKMRPAPFADTDAGLTAQVREIGKKLSEAHAKIAMMAESLSTCITVNYHGTTQLFNVPMVESAIEATAADVSAWEASKLEPLRREVAMLHCASTVAVRAILSGHGADAAYEKCKEAIECTQATALTYEREVKAKALEEMLTKYSVFSSLGYAWLRNLVKKDIENLRANK